MLRFRRRTPPLPLPEPPPLPVREEVWIHRSSGRQVRVWIEGGRRIVAYQVEDGFIFRDSKLWFLTIGPEIDRIFQFDADCFFERPRGRPPSLWSSSYNEGMNQYISEILFRWSDWREYQLDSLWRWYGEQLIAATRKAFNLKDDAVDRDSEG